MNEDEKQAHGILYRINGLAHYYNGRLVLSIDHWTLPAGKITGLAGPNGSGKSTLLKLLGFAEQPGSGEIQFKGRNSTPFASGLRDRIALLPQEACLLKRSVYNNIAYGLRIRKDRRNEAARVSEAMALVGLDADVFADRPWFALSGGEARRVGLAARLVLRPQVLLLDEPTTSVDAASAQRMKEAAVFSHRQWGTSLIIASHDLAWLQDICDDMVHLFEGRLLGSGQRTLLFGPWHDDKDRRVRMQLTGSQSFVAVRSPIDAGREVAAVDPMHLSLCQRGDRLPAGKLSIEGVLAGLSLEKRSGAIAASVTVGDTVFKIRLSAGDLSSARWIPGRDVIIAYDPQEVRWC